MGNLFEDGLYIVFQWMERLQREFQENMMKSFQVINRRKRIKYMDPRHAILDTELVQRLIFGARTNTRNRRWIRRPNRSRIATDYRHNIKYLGYQDRDDSGPWPVIQYEPYYFPGL